MDTNIKPINGPVLMDLGPRHMVQVLCITINGYKSLYLGPVPTPFINENGDPTVIVQNVEFGETLPVALASRLLSGELSIEEGRH